MRAALGVAIECDVCFTPLGYSTDDPGWVECVRCSNTPEAIAAAEETMLEAHARREAVLAERNGSGLSPALSEP